MALETVRCPLFAGPAGQGAEDGRPERDRLVALGHVDRLVQHVRIDLHEQGALRRQPADADEAADGHLALASVSTIQRSAERGRFHQGAVHLRRAWCQGSGRRRRR